MSVLNLLRSRRQEKVADVYDLARRVVAGEGVDADRILASCESSGMTDEDFAATVELIRERTELRKVAAGLEAAERDAKQLEEGLEKAHAAHEAMVAKFFDGIRPLQGKLAQHKQAVQTAASALTQLSSDSMLPLPLVKARAAARRRLADASDGVRDAQKQLREVEHHIAQAHANQRNSGITIFMKENEVDAILSRADYSLAVAMERLKKAEAERAESQAAFDAIDRQCAEF